MAKVITTELQHSGASGANITLDSSKNVTCENNLTVDGTTTLTGAVTLPNNTVTNATVADDAIGIAELSATGTASATTFLRGDNAWAAAGGGLVKQVKHMGTTTGVTSTDEDAWSDTNLTNTITMAQATNKLIVHVNLHCALYNSTSYDYASQRMNNLATQIVWSKDGSDYWFDRDSTDASGAYGFRFNNADTSPEYNNIMGFFPRTYEVDPDTANQVTVKIQFKAGKDNMSVGVNQSCRSTMTIWEIEYN